MRAADQRPAAREDHWRQNDAVAARDVDDRVLKRGRAEDTWAEKPVVETVQQADDQHVLGPGAAQQRVCLLLDDRLQHEKSMRRVGQDSSPRDIVDIASKNYAVALTVRIA